MTEAERTALEERLAAMTDQELAHEMLHAEFETEEADIIAGECERRNVDV